MEWSDGHGGREGEDSSGLREEDVGGGHGGKEGAGPQWLPRFIFFYYELKHLNLALTKIGRAHV